MLLRRTAVLKKIGEDRRRPEKTLPSKQTAAMAGSRALTNPAPEHCYQGPNAPCREGRQRHHLVRVSCRSRCARTAPATQPAREAPCPWRGNPRYCSELQPRRTFEPTCPRRAARRRNWSSARAAIGSPTGSSSPPRGGSKSPAGAVAGGGCRRSCPRWWRWPSARRGIPPGRASKTPGRHSGSVGTPAGPDGGAGPGAGLRRRSPARVGTSWAAPVFFGMAPGLCAERLGFGRRRRMSCL